MVVELATEEEAGEEEDEAVVVVEEEEERWRWPSGWDGGQRTTR